METLLEYSQIFGCQILVDSHTEIKRCFCKHDLKFMSSGVNSLTIASLSNPSFQPIVVGRGLMKGLKIIPDITLF